MLNFRYLGRRGCWVTAFNFAKLLYALDPVVGCYSQREPRVDEQGDPHGAVFWLDFLAVKSGNGDWLRSMASMRDTPVSAWTAYPGMAYALALAVRAQEERVRVKVSSASRFEKILSDRTTPRAMRSCGLRCRPSHKSSYR